MELANASHDTADSTLYDIRTATRQDAGTITRLLETAAFRHLHVDWRLPVEWLGSPGFVVCPKAGRPSRLKGVAAQLFGESPKLSACLAVMADPPPAAWVRVAAITNPDYPQAILSAMLERVLPYLRETAVTQLGWLVNSDWPEQWLEESGFSLLNHIETYVKTDLERPSLAQNPGIVIRPAQPEDMETLAQIETAAFEPLWRYSAATLAIARHEAMIFDVAFYQERLVGYQLSLRSGSGAHLVRLAVDPTMQGQGVGRTLLAQAIDEYRRHGLYWVTLNTQVNNFNSQHLYQKFGFQPNGQHLPVWHLIV